MAGIVDWHGSMIRHRTKVQIRGQLTQSDRTGGLLKVSPERKFNIESGLAVGARQTSWSDVTAGKDQIGEPFSGGQQLLFSQP